MNQIFVFLSFVVRTEVGSARCVSATKNIPATVVFVHVLIKIVYVVSSVTEFTFFQISVVFQHMLHLFSFSAEDFAALATQLALNKLTCMLHIQVCHNRAIVSQYFCTQHAFFRFFVHKLFNIFCLDSVLLKHFLRTIFLRWLVPQLFVFKDERFFTVGSQVMFRRSFIFIEAKLHPAPLNCLIWNIKICLKITL